jgi:hypothetical protein
MTWVAAAIAGSAIVGGIASSNAARTQARAADRATEAQERMFNKQVQLQEPFRQAGVNALPELVAASRYEPFTMEKFQADPGYAFRLKEGLRALESSAAARGGLLSGNQMRGVTQFGQELGSQEFTNAFNRYQAERAARLNPLQSLTGMGQTTAANIAGQAGQLGQNIGANIIGAGNARASGYMGVANALSGGLGQYLNYSQGQDMLKAYRDANTLAAFNANTSRGRFPGAGMPAGVPLPPDVV